MYLPLPTESLLVILKHRLLGNVQLSVSVSLISALLALVWVCSYPEPDGGYLLHPLNVASWVNEE